MSTDRPPRLRELFFGAPLLLILTTGIDAQEPAPVELELPQVNVEFSVDVLGVFPVTGQFGDVRASLSVLPGGTDSGLDIRVCPYSVDTGNSNRDRLLRSRLFFNVERFPAIQFRNVRVLSKPDGSRRLEGSLSLNAVTRPVVFIITEPEQGARAAARVPQAHKAQARISRSSFGLNALPLVVSDEVEVTVYINGDPASISEDIRKISGGDPGLAVSAR
jgi:polyisoprenoid-binding protein YceI